MANIYLDYNASCPLRPTAKGKMMEAMDILGNPSSVHWHGRQSRQIIDQAREQFAEAFGISSKKIIFTSGATEGNNWIIKQFPGTVLASATEHVSTLSVRPDLITIPVKPSGLLDLEYLDKTLKTLKDSFLLSVAAANNETGIIQPILDIKDIVKKYNGFIHCDAAQVIGKGNWGYSFDQLGQFDFVTLSAHKFGGPVGTGVVMINPDVPITPLLLGGGQERSFRAGTQNTIDIAGMAGALKECMNETLSNRLAIWKNTFEEELKSQNPYITIVGEGDHQRLSNTTCLIVPNVKGEFLVMRLDIEGISVSSGSACSSGKVNSSRVLKAMGYSDDMPSQSIRISSGWNTHENDYPTILKTLQKILLKEEGKRQ